MIVKKPFRVTNKTLEYNFTNELFDSYYEKELSLDLQDARELIDKQEAIIKEMRELHERLSLYNLDYMIISQINDILEKTKDYA